MGNKRKGSNAERELLLKLYNKGFAVSRVAGSGCSRVPTPDLIALNKKKSFAIECKTKKGKYLNIKKSQIKELEIWEKLSSSKSYIGWRLGKNKWYFLHISKLKKTKKAYSIKKDIIVKKGYNFSDFIKLV